MIKSRGVIQGKEEPLAALFAVESFTVRLFHDRNNLAVTGICRLKLYSDITDMNNTFLCGWNALDWGGGGGGVTHSNSFIGTFDLFIKAS